MLKDKTKKLIPALLSVLLLLYPPVLGLVLSVFNIHANTFYPPYSTIEVVWLVLWVVVAILICFFYFDKWWQRILFVLILGPSLPLFQSISVTSFSYLYFGQWILLAAWIFFIFRPIGPLGKEPVPFIKDPRRWLLLVGGCLQTFVIAWVWWKGSHYFFVLTVLVGVFMMALAVGGWKRKWAIPIVVGSFFMHGVIIGFSWLVPMVQAWLRDSMNF